MELSIITGPACAETLISGIEKRITELSGRPFRVTTWKNHKFRDGEFLPQINENVRGADVYVVQPTNQPEENFKYLKLLLGAAAGASAFSVTAVLPYMGGLRQDRKDRPRVDITAKQVAKEIEQAMTGAPRRHVIILHPHFQQIQIAFDIPTDLIYPTDIIIRQLKEVLGENLSNFIPVAPDTGALKLASIFAKRLESENLAFADKRRDKDDQAYIKDIVGYILGKIPGIFEDIIDTANTLKGVMFKLYEKGAEKNTGYIFATHGVLAKGAIENIIEAKVKHVFITDSINHENDNLPKELITVTSVGELIGEAIYRNHTNQSLSAISGMFNK
ncbi:MAG: ribose-phosphate diphosphokinase [Patescibacteria group bacterium]|nr:ribose-phosphate diphosphokinase [Patescibacteria group bacterium]